MEKAVIWRQTQLDSNDLAVGELKSQHSGTLLFFRLGIFMMLLKGLARMLNTKR